MPKLSRIPSAETSIKHSFNLKKSTSDTLQAYHQFYCQALGLDIEKVALKDVAEQILLDFMNSDKDFQRNQAGSDASAKPVVQSKEVMGAARAASAAGGYAASGQDSPDSDE